MILHKLIKEDINIQLEDIKNHTFDRKNDEQIIFHCYWSNNLGFNQVISILSCYNTNIKNSNNKIILWVDSVQDNQIYNFISHFCEIKLFDHMFERINTPLENYDLNKVSALQKISSFYSDYVRYILLSKYGGLYFDLDVFFYKKFDYLFDKYKNFVYTWEKCNHPNGAIYYVNKNDKDMIDKFINYFVEYGSEHFGFQDSFQTRKENQKYFNFESEIELNVLPCAWFDPIFLGGGEVLNDWFSLKKDTEHILFSESYCFHWHNRNHLSIEKGSSFYYCIKKLIKELNLEKTIKID